MGTGHGSRSSGCPEDPNRQAVATLPPARSRRNRTYGVQPVAYLLLAADLRRQLQRALSAFAVSMTCYDIPTVQLGLHCSEKTRSTPRCWRSCFGRTCCPKPGSRRRKCASSGHCCGTGSAWSGSARSCATGSTRSPPTTAMTGRPATGPGRAAAGWPSWTCPQPPGRSSPTP